VLGDAVEVSDADRKEEAYLNSPKQTMHSISTLEHTNSLQVYGK